MVCIGSVELFAKFLVAMGQPDGMFLLNLTGRVMSGFLRNHQTAFQRGCSILHSH